MVGYGEQLDTLISWVSVQLQNLGIFYVYINVIDIILSATLMAVQIVGCGEQLVTLISWQNSVYDLYFGGGEGR